MIRVQQVKCRPGHSEDELTGKLAAILRIKAARVARHEIRKQSVDARKKPEIWLSYVVDVALWAEERRGDSPQAGPAGGREKQPAARDGGKQKKELSPKQEEALVKRLRNPQVTVAREVPYHFPAERFCYRDEEEKKGKRPVIVGTGPAGLFCGYLLAKHGFCPLLLERGAEVEERLRDVERFWDTGRLDPESNVQFGEGGAGTFSDGKLNTLVKDKDGRNAEVLRIFAAHGAPSGILYESKPHIGTDILVDVVKSMRQEIERLGGEVRFHSKVTGLEREGERLCGVRINGGEQVIPCRRLVLAIGHSARDTFEMLDREALPMEAKSFAVGLRVEHPQTLINLAQYGEECPEHLPPASYKVTARTSGGRGVYSFCMCPGGYVVNASSEEGRLAVNGMSYSDRAGRHANSAVIVSVTPEDYPGGGALAGIAFQRELEERAFRAGQGKIPVEPFGSFRQSREECPQGAAEMPAQIPGGLPVGAECAPAAEKAGGMSRKAPCTKGGYQPARVRDILPEELNLALIEGMEHFGKLLPGFDGDDVPVSGVESRTSSPVRILRDTMLQSSLRGLYPCGEGAGYAGGITSAAMDGMRVAERIALEMAAEAAAYVKEGKGTGLSE